MSSIGNILLSDSEIIERYLDTQNSQYFDLLYDKYVNKIFAKCIALLKNETDANDATQDVFVKVLLNLSKFKKESKLSTWIYSITYNQCIDRLRKKSKKKETALNESYDPHDDQKIDEKSDAELFEIQYEQLGKTLDAIDPKDKVILLMKYLDGMSIREIAGALGITESATKMRIARAKHRVIEMHREMFKK